MPPLTDQELLTCYKNALANWRFSEYVSLDRVPERWLLTQFPELKVKALARLMHDHVAAGGVIDQQKETREQWSIYDFHYDLRIPYKGRLLYIETRLFFEKPQDPDDPRVFVVNIHDA